MPSADHSRDQGVPARRAALQILDAVLRRGETLDGAAARERKLALPDHALAMAIAGEVLRRMPDLDSLIDSATRQRLPDDSKARMVLRVALAQKIGLGTPDHAVVATALPLVDGGPRRLVHGVLGTLLRRGAPVSDSPRLPADVEERWRDAWGSEVVDAARRQISRRPPLDLTFAEDSAAQAYAAEHDGVSLAPNHVRLPSSAVADLPGYQDGGWWIQDLAASLPARLMPADAGDVLDLCAAPGGKTMQLAAAGHRVTAVDSSESRLGRLRESRPYTSRRGTGCRRCPEVEARAHIRRGPARRALLRHRHLPPSPGGPLPGPAEDRSRQCRSPGEPAFARGRMAEAGRDPDLFGVLARAAGGRTGNRRLFASARQFLAQPDPCPSRLRSRIGRSGSHPPRLARSRRRSRRLLYRAACPAELIPSNRAHGPAVNCAFNPVRRLREARR